MQNISTNLKFLLQQQHQVRAEKQHTHLNTHMYVCIFACPYKFLLF